MGEWAVVQGRRSNHIAAMEEQLASLQEELAWMRSRGHHAPPQGRSVSKGMGKGKGLGKGRGASQGPAPNPPAPPPQGPARRAPNLKPLEDRATPTVVEIKCSRCQAYNWTTRSVCRSCQTPLARPQGVSNAVTQSAPAAAKASGTVPGKSYAQAAAGVASQSVLLLDKEALSKRQAELETVVATLPEDSPLKEELGTQLEVVKDKLRDPRQPGARLDSAAASLKKATARREKAEETLKQAQEALENARLEETRAQKELEEAKKAAAPPPQPEQPPEGAVSLSSADVEGLIGFFQELVAEREAPGVEPPQKKNRCSPYGQTVAVHRVKDDAVRAKLERGSVYLAHLLGEARKSGDGSCQAEDPVKEHQKESPAPANGAVPGTVAQPQSDPIPPAPTQVDEDSLMADAQRR